jgi:hypothetical protein
MEMPPWKTVTREERYFTSVLHHELINNIVPFSKFLCFRLWPNQDIGIADIGFEVCFFRDGFRQGLIEKRCKELEKQTFDFMFFLSNGSAVIVEAKAQQSFSLDQIEALEEAKRLILQSEKYKVPEVYLIGLCSSNYTLKEETEARFDGMMTWKDLSRIYPDSRDIFMRADDIYGN